MKDEHVDLWSTDEVHFQQHGSRCRMWIPPEIKDREALPKETGGTDRPDLRNTAPVLDPPPFEQSSCDEMPPICR
jgi:hypothetical protein